MPVETGQFITDLNPNWPTGTDLVSAGDDHDRLTKLFVQNSFPNIDAAVNATPADLNLLTGAAVGGSGLALTGFVQMFAGIAAPTGWLLCDGLAIDVGETALIALVGANTPDLRGQFIRGWSDDALVDPDGARAPLTAQAEDFLAHTHESSGTAVANDDAPGDPGSNPKAALGAVTGSTGGDETRPVNVALSFIIKT
jgi:microcystin-dependent protein